MIDREIKWDFEKNQNIIKTLGLIWNSTADSFRISSKKEIDFKGSIFDPLGLIMPITVIGKPVLHELWQFKKDWDEKLLREKFQKSAKYLEKNYIS